MSIEVGAKLPGKVSGITNFGAFIDLGEGKTGLVHISEVSNGFVKDIHDVLTVGDEVTVKVTSVGDDGKIGLSIRKAQEPAEGQQQNVNFNVVKTIMRIVTVIHAQGAKSLSINHKQITITINKILTH